MSILKDYIAYARSYVNPKLSEEAAQYLIQAYVGKRTTTVIQAMHACIVQQYLVD